MLDVGEIKHLGNGYIDTGIKYNGKLSNSYKANTYFPFGTDVEEFLKIIENAILKPKEIKLIELKNKALKGFEVVNKENQIFVLLFNETTVQFYPKNK